MMDSALQRNSAFPIRNDINWNLCQDTHQFVNTMNAPTFSNGIVGNNFQPNVYQGAFSPTVNDDTNSDNVNHTFVNDNIPHMGTGTSHRKRKSHGLQSTESVDDWDNFRGRKVYISEKKMMSKFSQMNLDLESSTTANVMNGDLNMVPLSGSRNQQEEGVIIEELFDDDEFLSDDEDDGYDCSIEFSDVLKNHLDQKNKNCLPDKIINKIIEPKLPCRELVLWQPPVSERFQNQENAGSVQSSSPSTSRRQALKATRHFTNSNLLPRVDSDAEMDCSAISSGEISNNMQSVNSSVFISSSGDLSSFPSSSMSPTWNIPSCFLIQDAWSGSQDDQMMS